ncbi:MULTISPECIES: hypothetical protein [Pseudomonas]|uniref:Uncharacterized protein n=1 Tax=Pseudomonas lactis TaxID=1615674 RepID=A0ABS9FJD4_9PSED|nr:MULTISPECIES: hypothetical protein [Pseudomonas]MCF4971837.1 hypothetical protein [Pseudomonas lactis]MCF5000020.1 hypothetical protein [Pseudomonas lactis]MCF5004913.1 hypothetical protein [Pseudomonas lactis]MCF5011203.1 hypothetical protein [Pseudomonas lactis]MCF5016776.1 hypothetical protein [Pseudomonas lactis]
MKDGIIRLNDYLCYLAIAIVTYAGFITYGMFGGLGGFVVGAVIAGFWLVLSGIYDELKKLTNAKGL